MRIELVERVTPELVDAFRRLVPQLSSSARVPETEAIEEIVSSDCTFVFVARSEEEGIIGMLTLALFRIPTGTRAWIEDVVVDEAARRSGVGAGLVQEALRTAEARGARTTDLTSRPERVAANRLYERLGFERRATNVFRRQAF